MLLAGPVVEPTSVLTDNATVQFQRMPVFNGVKNTSLEFDDGATLVIAVEPIKQNEIGRVAISGVVPARFRVTSGEKYALGFNSVEELQISSFGLAKILYVAGSIGSERQWGLIQLGASGGRTQIIEFTENWPINTNKTCSLIFTSPKIEIEVRNVFAEVFNVCGEQRYGAATFTNGQWYLTAVEFGND